jgi:citrate lyase subunit beta/citryl-CoA lyase
MILRSFLFVPADSDRKLAKALGVGADALILDLEDSVAASRKLIARGMARDYLTAHAGARASQLWVRINPLAEGGLDDLVAVVRARPDGLMVPKASGPAELARISDMLDVLERRDGVAAPIRLLPVATETAAAALALPLYAHAVLPRLYGLTWGAEDLSTALGASTNRDASGAFAFTYRVVRSQMLLAAKAAGVEAIDTLHADFRDAAGLARTSAEAVREGFSGRQAIHPDQVGPINAAFTPSADDIAHARAVVAAFAAQPDAGVAALDGKMIDRPHLVQAERLLARAGMAGGAAQG